ncbi:MAG: hypothetical protein LAN62_10870 [Acidobacteriia bacterium]|nr:hypothetical protein [Terriglobia bacterium]
MRSLQALCLVLTTLFITACVPVMSLHPLFLPKDYIFDTKLLGDWRTREEKPYCRFEKADNGYWLYFLNKDGEPVNKYQAHLANLQGSLFLDILLEEVIPQDLIDRAFPLLLVPAHTFYQIKIEGDSLEYRFMDDDWVAKMSKQRKLKLASAQVDDLTVLTAPTEKFQKFVLKNLGTEEAFSKYEDGRLHHPPSAGK